MAGATGIPIPERADRLRCPFSLVILLDVREGEKLEDFGAIFKTFCRKLVLRSESSSREAS
ncbi:hypothetical protein B1A99_16305 [Cohnella sp. CIP 111063]|nr:hypothetical protein B1A99_16305 [Cohnella sp. CIP 111063]